MKAARCTRQALLAEPVEQLPQLCRSVRGTKVKEHVSGIRQQVHLKRLNGQKLSTVERYLSRQGAALERRLFAPSLLSVSGELLTAVLRPAPILMVIGLILASEASSSAWLESPAQDISTDAIDYAEVFVEAPTALAAEETNAAPSQVKEEVQFAALSPFTLSSEASAPQAAPAPAAPAQASQAVQTAKLTAPAKASAPIAVNKNRGMIEFISGVIAVYYPAENDSGKIARHIVEVSEAEEMDPLYVAALIAVESRFMSHARSSVGATGLMQLLPSTAKEVVQKQFGRSGNPALTDPRTNIKLGIRYLKGLEKRYRGNRHLALAAYNWGPANVDKGKRIPGSVQKYATTILEKTHRWKRHFQKAVATATDLEKKMEKTA